MYLIAVVIFMCGYCCILCTGQNVHMFDCDDHVRREAKLAVSTTLADETR